MFDSSQSHKILFGWNAVPTQGSHLTVSTDQVFDSIVIHCFGETNIVKIIHIIYHIELFHSFFFDSGILLYTVIQNQQSHSKSQPFQFQGTKMKNE